MKTRLNRLNSLIATALAIMAGVEVSSAASATWTTAGGGTWSDTANWGANPAADGTDATADFNQVNIPAGGNTITLDTSRTIGNLIFGDTDTSTAGTWTLSGSALTLATSSGTSTITTNVNTTISTALGGTNGLAKSGSATLTLSGSNNYSGGTQLNAGTLVINNGNALGSGTLTALSGTISLTTASGVGNAITLSGSNASVTLISNQGSAGYGSNFTGSADQTVVISSNPVNMNNATRQFVNFLGTVNVLAGATLSDRLTTTWVNGGDSTLFNVNGTISSRNGLGTWNLGGLTGSGTLSMGTAGSNGIGLNYTVGARNDTSDTFSGVIKDGDTANGKLISVTKVGTGTQTLSGSNTYTGTTTVSAGTLRINGYNSGTGAMNVSGSGAILAGSGTVAGLTTVSANAHIAPGSSVGTLTLGSLTLNSGSILDYEFNGTPANDQIVVTGSNGLTLSGTAGFNLYQEGGTTQFVTSGSYNLISYAGTLGGLLGNLSVLNPASGKSYTFGNTGSLITLTIVDISTYTWNVDANGSWATASNWDVNSVPNSTAATVVLGGTASAPRTVSLNGDKTVAGVTFNNVNGYTIASGTGGSLILSASAGNANVIVNSGSGHAISAPVSLVSSAMVSIPNATDALTVSGTVSGGGALTMSGSGTLVLSASNSYGGGTTLVGGTVQIGTNSSLGSNSSVSITGNSTVRSGAASLAPAYNFAVSTGAVGTFDTNGNNMALSGTISGLGGLGKMGAGTLTVSASNTYSGVTTVSNGVLKLANANAAQNSVVTVNVDNGLVFGNGITNFAVGGLSGTSAVVLQDESTAAVQLTVGKNDSTATFNGVLSGSGSLVKTGAGTQSISGTNGTNTYSGGTRVDAGTFTVNVNGGAGTGDVTLNGGTFRFGNIVNNAVTLGNNFIVSVPSTISSSNKSNGFNGTLSGSANLTLGSDNTGFFTPGGSWAAYSGTATIQPNSGSMTFRMDTNFDAPNSVTILNGSVAMNYKNGTNSTHTINFGSLTTGSSSSFGGSAAGGGSIIYSIGSLGLSSTLAGSIFDGSTKTAITKVGAGTLTISAVNNNYTGAVNINGGIIAATTSNLAGTGSASALGAMNVARNINVNNSGTLQFDAGDVFGSNLIAPTATLVINAGGLVTNNGASFNTLGPVTLNGGTLTGTGGSTNTQYQMYQLSGQVTVGGTSASTISGAGTTGGGGDGTTTVGYHLNGPITFNVADATSSAASDLIVSGALIDGIGASPVAGGITKTGAGTMALTGSNSYTGATNVNNGTLQFAQPNASVVALTGSLTIATTGTAVLTAHTGGAGQVKVLDLSALMISGSSPFAGDGGKLDTGAVLASAAPVPEPGTTGLILVGVIAAVGYFRKTRGMRA